MRKTSKFFVCQSLRFISLIVLFLLLTPSSEAVFKVKSRERGEGVAYRTGEELKSEHLRRGEILTDGGFLDHGVWGMMEGVVDAPPELVWRLYIQVNDWKRYGLPSLIDSRIVPPGIVQEIGETSRVRDFYQVLGDRVVETHWDRRPGGHWTNHLFQFFNVPWPVADRWFILKMDYDETGAEKGIYRAVWTKVAGNVRTNDGDILFEPFEGNKKQTHMLYNVKSDPGSFVPRFLVRWAIKKTMPEAIRTIRKEAARVQQKQPPVLLKIQ